MVDRDTERNMSELACDAEADPALRGSMRIQIYNRKYLSTYLHMLGHILSLIERLGRSEAGDFRGVPP